MPQNNNIAGAQKLTYVCPRAPAMLLFCGSFTFVRPLCESKYKVYANKASEKTPLRLVVIPQVPLVFFCSLPSQKNAYSRKVTTPMVTTPTRPSATPPGSWLSRIPVYRSLGPRQPLGRELSCSCPRASNKADVTARSFPTNHKGR